MFLLGQIISFIILIIYRLFCVSSINGGKSVIKNKRNKNIKKSSNQKYLLINYLGNSNLNFMDFNNLYKIYKPNLINKTLSLDLLLVTSNDTQNGYSIKSEDNKLYVDDLKIKWDYMIWEDNLGNQFIKYYSSFCKPNYQILLVEPPKNNISNILKLEIENNIMKMMNYREFAYVQTFNTPIYLQYNDWRVAVKIDGIPAIVTCYMNKLYRYNKSKNQMASYFECLNIPCDEELLIITEFTEDEIYIVDALVYGEKILSEETLDIRSNEFKNICDILGPRFRPQIFYQIENWDNMMELRNLIKNDGFIFQSNHNYWETILMKWKEFWLSSIDLLYYNKDLYYNNNSKCTKVDYFLSSENIESDLSEFNDFDIVEVVPMNKIDNKIEYKYLKTRIDKDVPNSHHIMKDTLDIMNDRIDISQLKGETIHFMKHLMRQRSNWVYRKFLHNGQTILELGSGDGRSSKMWKLLNLNVWCVEPNKDSYLGLKNRPNIENTLNTVGQDSAIQKWIPKENVDAVMMIHSLTFFFESPAILQQLFDNLNWSLKPNGLVIITTVDGSKLEDVDCKAYSLKMKKPNKVTISMKNRFTLVDEQDEYLVNIDELNEVAKKNNYKLIFKQPYLNDKRLDVWTNKYYTAGITLVFKRQSSDLRS